MYVVSFSDEKIIVSHQKYFKTTQVSHKVEVKFPMFLCKVCEFLKRLEGTGMLQQQMQLVSSWL